MRAFVRLLTSRRPRASHGAEQHPRPRARGRRAAVQHRLEEAVDAEDAPGAGECEAEERKRLQRPDPVPLAWHVERSERDVHLPEEAGDARETREDAEEQSRAQRELNEAGLQYDEGAAG